LLLEKKKINQTNTKSSHFSSSPGLIAITFPSTTATAPLVAAAIKSQVI